MKNEEVILSGIFTGISGLFARMAMIDTDFGVMLIPSLLTNPLFLLSALSGVFGFSYLQIALHGRDISFVEPAVSSIAIITPVVLAVVFLREFVPISRWIGVGLLLLGVIGIQQGEEKSLVGIISKKLK